MDGALVNSAVQRLWGKLSADGEHWLPLVTHLTDTAETAALIWDEWVPLHVRRTVEKDFRETGLMMKNPPTMQERCSDSWRHPMILARPVQSFKVRRCELEIMHMILY